MKKITLAIIYRNTANEAPMESTPNIVKIERPLQIDGHDVRFLIDVLRQQSQFKEFTDDVWKLQFFSDSPFKQQFYVSVVHMTIDAEHTYPNEHDKKALAIQLRKQSLLQAQQYLSQPREVVRATFIHTDAYEPNSDVILMASYLVRETNSLKFDTLSQHSDRFIHVDGRGTALLSAHGMHQHTFKRQVILLALSKAYLLAMNTLMNDLAHDCENPDKLPQLYKKSLIFNAKYYFATPVKVNRYDAVQLWQGIRQCMMIDDINREVIQQLKSVHQLLSEEEETKQLKAESRLNKRIGWLGLGIGLLSLISLFEITPKKITDFISAWIHWIF